jgi:hypothetical protein
MEPNFCSAKVQILRKLWRKNASLLRGCCAWANRFGRIFFVFSKKTMKKLLVFGWIMALSSGLAAQHRHEVAVGPAVTFGPEEYCFPLQIEYFYRSKDQKNADGARITTVRIRDANTRWFLLLFDLQYQWRFQRNERRGGFAMSAGPAIGYGQQRQTPFREDGIDYPELNDWSCHVGISTNPAYHFRLTPPLGVRVALLNNFYFFGYEKNTLLADGFTREFGWLPIPSLQVAYAW